MKEHIYKLPYVLPKHGIRIKTGSRTSIFTKETVQSATLYNQKQLFPFRYLYLYFENPEKSIYFAYYISISNENEFYKNRKYPNSS